jgi:hypothetical protein
MSPHLEASPFKVTNGTASVSLHSHTNESDFIEHKNTMGPAVKV